MTDTLIRIDTPDASYFYETESEDAALDRYAQEAGYGGFSSLAHNLGKHIDLARGELVIKRVNYTQATFGIIRETLDSNAIADGATDRFKSARDWADWCLEGKTGDDAKQFARDHKLDVNKVWHAVEDTLRTRDIDDINAAFENEGQYDKRCSVLFGDVAGKEPLYGECSLPDQFFHHSADGLYRYTYTGPHSYDMFERRDEGDRVIWIGCGSEHISDDTTAEDLEASLA